MTVVYAIFKDSSDSEDHHDLLHIVETEELAEKRVEILAAQNNYDGYDFVWEEWTVEDTSPSFKVDDEVSVRSGKTVWDGVVTEVDSYFTYVCGTERNGFTQQARIDNDKVFAYLTNKEQ